MGILLKPPASFRFATDMPRLVAQFDGLFGYQLLNTTLLALDSPSGYGNNSVRVLDYWTPTRQNASTPRPGNTASGAPSTAPRD